MDPGEVLSEENEPGKSDKGKRKRNNLMFWLQIKFLS